MESEDHERMNYRESLYTWRKTDYQGGTRLSVEFILDLLASDVSEHDILEDYPHLSKDDIHACLKYAAFAMLAPMRNPATIILKFDETLS